MEQAEQESSFLSQFILCCIALNTLVLMMDAKGNPAAMEQALAMLNNVFTVIFLGR